jgi:quercetin dioxygenase-like cupin family protein
MDDLLYNIHKLADIADYQKDSIVSKIIIDKDVGSVTYFAFDKGQGLSEHTAPFDAMVTIIEGKTEITISGEKYQLGKNEMIIMPANKPHSLKAIDKFKMLLTMIKS